MHAQRTYADNGAAFLETATNKLLSSMEQRVREILEAAQAQAAEITRAAEERAAELLDEASLVMTEAEERLDETIRIKTDNEQLERKREHVFRGALKRATKMQNAIEELSGLHRVQLAELERLRGVGSNAEELQGARAVDQASSPVQRDYENAPRESTPAQPTAPTPPGLTREPSAGAARPNWADIFRKREEGGRRRARRWLRRA